VQVAEARVQPGQALANVGVGEVGGRRGLPDLRCLDVGCKRAVEAAETGENTVPSATTRPSRDAVEKALRKAAEQGWPAVAAEGRQASRVRHRSFERRVGDRKSKARGSLRVGALPGSEESRSWRVVLVMSATRPQWSSTPGFGPLEKATCSTQRALPQARTF